MNIKKKIVAIGGGGFTHKTDPELDLFILSQSKKKKIKLGFLPTASKDDEEKIKRFYHGLGKYKKNHESRKPKPGMLLKAINDFNIDANSSILIGDEATDIQAGMAAGVGTNIYLGKTDISKDVSSEFYTKISSLAEAKDFLKDELR